MSVGIDFGDHNMVVAVVQGGDAAEACENEAGSRQTPAFVSFARAPLQERLLGEPGFTGFLRNVENTVHGVKRLLGRSYSDPLVQSELPRLGFKVRQLEEDRIGIEVEHAGSKHVFAPEQVVAMLLGNLKRTAEHSLSAKVKDVVIAVPGYWDDAQRRAMLAAAEIAGLHCIKLVNEHTASALQAGLHQPAFTKPRRVLLVDVGYSSSSFSLVMLSSTGLKVLHTAFASDLGGRCFDEALATYVSSQFADRLGAVALNSRNWYRLLAACEKQIKRVISSGNSKAALTVENIVNDTDLSLTVTREEFERITSPIVDKCIRHVSRLLTEYGITIDDLDDVLLTGGGARLSYLQAKLQQFLHLDLSKTLNFEESVAQGAALQCYLLHNFSHPRASPRAFAVDDATHASVTLAWGTSAGVQRQSAIVFPRGTSFPTAKLVAIPLESPTHVTLCVTSDEGECVGDSGKTSPVGSLLVPATGTPRPAILHVRAEIDLHEIFDVQTAISPIQATVESSRTPAADARTSACNSLLLVGTPITSPLCTSALPPWLIQQYAHEEAALAAADQLAAETAEARNSLESYVYTMRDKLTGDLAPFIAPAEAQTFAEQLSAADNWLQEVCSDVDKTRYGERLVALQAHGSAFEQRKYEAENRPSLVGALRELLEQYKLLVLAKAERRITPPEERLRMRAEVDDVSRWLAQMLAAQAAVRPCDPPVLTCCQLSIKQKKLLGVCQPIAAKCQPSRPTSASPNKVPKRAAATSPRGAHQRQAPIGPRNASPQHNQGHIF
eukprot:TRINITY_DN1303_c0_g1_i2.p1 TRINITY_DN1303_c0_g1~~TRINITY_DN1303_c0_g1_i2.p1  ORF type:complete len:782 (+),score=129.06 TRINITY_DN1303_c0_g1_i2:36-2381(+)